MLLISVTGTASDFGLLKTGLDLDQSSLDSELLREFSLTSLDKADYASLIEALEASKECFEAMHSGLWGYGRDVSRLFQALDRKSPEQVELLRQVYPDHYRDRTAESIGDLDSDLARELRRNKSKLERARLLLESNQAGADAVGIFDATEGWLKNSREVRSILSACSDAERQALMLEFEERFGVTLEARLEKNLRGVTRDEALALLSGDPSERDAARLKKALFRINPQIKDIYSILHGLSEDERSGIERAYAANYESDLAGDLSRGLVSDDARIARHLIEGDHVRAATVMIHAGIAGGKIDSDRIHWVLDRTSDEFRDAIIAEYEKEYGRESSPWAPQLVRDLRDELTGDDWELAAIMLFQGGLTEAQKLYFAMAGRGTEESIVLGALDGKTAEELEQLRGEYFEFSGQRLDEIVDRELAGRDHFIAMQALKGIPKTIEELVSYIHERYDFEIKGAGHFIVDHIPSRVNKSRLLDEDLERLDREFQAARADGVLDNGELNRLFRSASYVLEDLDSFSTAVDGVTSLASTLVATAAATGVSVATGPVGGLALLGATGASGAGYIAAKRAIEGPSYDTHGVVKDAVIGVLEGLVTVASAGAGSVVGVGKEPVGEVVAIGAQRVGREAAKEGILSVAHRGISGGFGGAVGGGLLSAISEGTWKGGFIVGLKRVLASAAMDGVAGAAGSAGVAAVSKTAKNLVE